MVRSSENSEKGKLWTEMAIYRRHLVIGIIIAGLVAILIFNIPQIIARVSTDVYIKGMHPEMHLSFSSFEFNKYIAEYIITYKGEGGVIYNFTVGPKIFPVQILHDPISGES
jgi:hypothetical protein